MIERDGEPVRVRLTVIDPARVGTRADVEVRAARGTRLGLVAGALGAAVGWPGDGESVAAFVDGAPVAAAILGVPPLLDGAVVTMGRAGGTAGRGAGTAGGLAEVHVVAGPDAGARFPLPSQPAVVGRGTEATLRIADPDVSRAHAEIMRSGPVVRVRDLGSTNGTRVGGRLVGGPPLPWPPGVPLQLGASLLVLRTADGDTSAGGGPAATVPDGAGHLLVNPAPRLTPPPVGGQVTFPEAPPEPSRLRLPWPALLLPLVLSVPLAWWLHQALFLAFALLSPLMMLGQYLADRRDRSGERRRAVERHRAEVDAAQITLAELLAAERARSFEDHPDPATVAAIAAGPLQRLWERRPTDGDALVLRVGLGRVTSVVTVRGSPPPEADPPVLDAVPVSLDLADPHVDGVAGLAGPRREVLALARCLIGQAVVACSPVHLRVVVLAADNDPDGSWEWAARLPHADGALPAPRDRRGDAAVAGDEVRDELPVLLVLDGAERLRRDPQVAALLGTAGAGGQVVALCLDADAARLPAECGATVALHPAGVEPGAYLTVRGRSPQPVQPDLVSPGWAERLGRDLAGLADATPRGDDRGLPASVRLLDLLGVGSRNSALPDPASGWARRRADRSRATTAVLGVTAAGPWHLDLARHGPHVLVAGTTGAGKSELLVTLVASLALTHPPDRLTVLLLDYKGGTAFGPLTDLPHTAGVLTDLDAHLARRALSSLRAELHRRERLLRRAGAGDIDAYDRARGPDDPPLSRLVIVVDEFRVLSEELPDLLTELVRVAVVGRSLGVHLVLATQRPAGVVTAEIRANVNLRIALRVRDRIDSDDVVDAPDASMLPADRPGRGVARIGGDPLLQFQAARATGRPPGAGPPAEVLPVRRNGRVVTARVVGPPRPISAASAVPDRRPDDLVTIVAACRAAAAREGLAPARAPWLPPLPDLVHPGDLRRLATAAPDGHGLDLGVTDLPEAQARGLLRWAVPAEGHLAVIGAPGSGRTGVARAIVGAACRGSRPVHVHVVDGGGRLGALGRLGWLGRASRVGSVVPASDTECAGRLLARLGDHIAAGHEGTPPLLLVVDGWEQVQDAWLPIEHGRLVDDLIRLARDGTAAGLRLAVTGGRALLTGAVAGLFTERLLLRAADPTDLVLAGVPASALPTHMPPGRVLRPIAGGVVEGQVVLDELDDLDDLPRRDDDTGPPLRLAPLPARLRVSQLLTTLEATPGGVAGALAAGMLPLGVGGDDATPLGPPVATPGWLIAGAAGTGRTTTLATAAAVLAAAGRAVVVVADDPGAGSDGASGDEAPAFTPAAVRTDPGPLLAALDERPAATLLVDGLATLADTIAEDQLLARLEAGTPALTGATTARWPIGPGPQVIGTCTPTEASLAYRGLTARLRGSGAGVLLGPTSANDGEAFGVRVTVRPSVPRGRALVVAGRTHAIQVARPDRAEGQA